MGDALARLREKGIVDDKPKSYKLMPDFKAARPVTVTFWPDGSVKLEIGSVCEILNPTEAMTVGQAMAGKYTSSMLQLATAQLSHDISKVSSEVVKIKEAQRR